MTDAADFLSSDRPSDSLSRDALARVAGSVSRRPMRAGAEVLLTGTVQQPRAPWSYLFPIPPRFAALDPASIARRPDRTARAEITLVERRGNRLVVGQDFDCDTGLIRPGASDWQAASEDDPSCRRVCEEGA